MRFDTSLEKNKIMKQIFCSDIAGVIMEFEDNKRRWAKNLYKEVLEELVWRHSYTMDFIKFCRKWIIRDLRRKSDFACQICGDREYPKRENSKRQIVCRKNCQEAYCSVCDKKLSSIYHMERHKRSNKHKQKVSRVIIKFTLEHEEILREWDSGLGDREAIFNRMLEHDKRVQEFLREHDR